MFDDRGIDRILLNRKTRVLKEKAPLEIPKLKFYKLTGDKRSVPISLDIPINDRLVLKEKFEYQIDEFVDIIQLIESFQNKYGFSDDIAKQIENKVSFQIIDHVERVSKKIRMAKLFKEKEQEKLQNEGIIANGDEQILLYNQQGTRVPIERRRFETASHGKVCKYCRGHNMESDQICRTCKLPFRLIPEHQEELDDSQKIAYGFISRMILRSEFLKTFSILQNLDQEDFKSLLVLSAKITNIIIDREDFDDESKGELIKMFESYIYNYHILGLSNVHIYPFLENVDDFSNEKIKVVSEKRGKPGRPKKSEVVKKFLRKTISNPVGRPKMTEEQKLAYNGKKRGRPAKKKKKRSAQTQKEIEDDILAIERERAIQNGEPIPETIEDCRIQAKAGKQSKNFREEEEDTEEEDFVESDADEEENLTDEEDAEDDVKDEPENKLGKRVNMLKRLSQSQIESIQQDEDHQNESSQEQDDYVPTNKGQKDSKRVHNQLLSSQPQKPVINTRRRLKLQSDLQDLESRSSISETQELATRKRPSQENVQKILSQNVGRGGRIRKSNGVFQQQLLHEQLSDSDE